MLKRACGALVEGGYLVLNVDDFELEGDRYGFIEDTDRAVKQYLSPSQVDRLRYQLGGPGDNQEAVLVYRK